MLEKGAQATLQTALRSTGAASCCNCGGSMKSSNSNTMSTLLTCGFIVAAGSASAAAAADNTSSSRVPASAFYAGLGAAGNYINYNDWTVDATGISNVYDDGELIASGTAGGPAVDLDLDLSWSFTPQIQLGYFNHFSNSQWMWGGKFTYNYMNASSTKENFLIPQYGSYGTEEFTGNAVVQSMEVSLSHQLALIPYLGRDFERGFVYVGVGPTLSKVDTDVTNLIGFADVLGRPTDISGRPQDFSSTDWVYGGAATIGGTFFVDRSWFIDVNYLFSKTLSNTANYQSTFVNPGPPLTFAGDLIGKSEGSFTTHTFALSINKAF
jgi:hypothetical protein